MDSTATLTKYIDQAIQRSWEVSPTSIYGLLIGLLILTIIALTTAVIIQWRASNAARHEFQTLLAQNIAVIQAFTSRFDGDGRELADAKLEGTIRGVVQSELQPITRKLERLQK